MTSIVQSLDETSWDCPYCGNSNMSIVRDGVLKDDFKEILVGCMKCNEMFIRVYKFVETIPLIRRDLLKQVAENPGFALTDSDKQVRDLAQLIGRKK